MVGPASWRWVAEELRASGLDVVLPSLVPAAAAGDVHACVRAAADQIGAGAADLVLVGHSGAGPLLPLIAAAAEVRPRRLVFVDAGIPPVQGDATLVPDDFAQHLRSIARDGILPPWSDWFGPEMMEDLVPDVDRRDLVVADLSRLPLRYFDARIAMPAGWSVTGDGAYVLLSEAYRPDAAEASSRGWPVVELLGNHLDIVNRPAAVAAAIAQLSG